MLRDASERSKTTQHNTPINKSEFPETVTVIDPRHPLYGQTFRLVQVEDRPDHGQCCLVEREWGQNSYIPLDVTDKSETRWVSSSIPLSIEAIRQLVSTYIRLTDGDQNDSTHTTDETSQRYSTRGSLEALDPDAKSTSLPDIGSDLPKSRSENPTSGGKA